MPSHRENTYDVIDCFCDADFHEIKLGWKSKHLCERITESEENQSTTYLILIFCPHRARISIAQRILLASAMVW